MSLAAGLGCAPESGSEDEGEPLMCDIPQLFVDRCGGEVCHGTGGSTAAGLDLSSPGVEGRVANTPGSSCAGILANPGDPESSLLYRKVTDDPGCGSRMPIGGEPLSDDERACLRDWISGLLPPTATDAGDSDDCPGCACEPMLEESCYEGPAETENVGICVGGTHVCANNGLAWSACEGQVLPRGEDCFTAEIDENCDGETPACSEEWSIAFGNELGQNMRGVGVDGDGNVYAVGDFEGAVSFGGEPLVADGEKFDVVIAKYDTYGNPVWSQRYGDSSNQYATNVIVDVDGNLVALGRMFGKVDFGGGLLDAVGTDDIFVVKLDRDGNHVWSRSFGGGDPDRAERLAFDGQGNVIVTGAFTGTADFGAGLFVSEGLRDAFVLRLDGSNGASMLSKQYGGAGDDYGFGIDADANDNLVIAGRFQQSIQLGAMLSSNGATDIYVAKLDAAGAVLWSAGYGGVGEDGAHDLKVHDASGDIFVTGYMSESVDFGGGPLVSAGMRDIFIAAFDGQGAHRWSAVYGDAIDQFTATSETNQWLTLGVDDAEMVHLAGSLYGSADFGGGTLVANGGVNPDVFFVKLDAIGSLIAASRYGSSSTDLGVGMTVAGTGHVLLAGRSYGSSIDFGLSGQVALHGNTDAFIAKLLP